MLLKTLFLGAFLCVCILNAGSRIEIAPRVTITPLIEVAITPELEKQIPEKLANYRHTMALIHNDSDRDITALTAYWDYFSIEQGRMVTGVVYTVDRYASPGTEVKPWIPAHSSMLLAPLAGAEVRFADAKDGAVGLNVDAVLFADGDVYGPDQYITGEGITGRLLAAKSISVRARKHKAAGKPYSTLRAELLRERPARPNKDEVQSLNWQMSYAASLERHATDSESQAEGFIKYLESFPTAPVWHNVTPTNEVK